MEALLRQGANAAQQPWRGNLDLVNLHLWLVDLEFRHHWRVNLGMAKAAVTKADDNWNPPFMAGYV